MKKQYIFIILIITMLYMIYLTISYKYNEYIINSHIEQLNKNNNKILVEIKEKISEIEYKNTSSYKNKILKENQGLKNKGEQVIYLITEKKYDKYTKKTPKLEDNKLSLNQANQTTNSMTIFEKWIFFLFLKDIR